MGRRAWTPRGAAGDAAEGRETVFGRWRWAEAAEEDVADRVWRVGVDGAGVLRALDRTNCCGLTYPPRTVSSSPASESLLADEESPSSSSSDPESSLRFAESNHSKTVCFLREELLRRCLCGCCWTETRSIAEGTPRGGPGDTADCGAMEFEDIARGIGERTGTPVLGGTGLGSAGLAGRCGVCRG